MNGIQRDSQVNSLNDKQEPIAPHVNTLNDHITETKQTDQATKRNNAKVITTPESLQKDFFFVRELGHGSQAKVFLAHRLSDNKSVTIKQLNIESVKTWKEYELFHREAEVLSKLNIQGVAKFYEAIECLNDNPPCSYIVQEYIEGTSLAKMIETGKRFMMVEVFDILLQLLDILKQLQSMDPPVIHRDIKPSNIMLTQDGNRYRVTLIDFGAVANPQVQNGGSTVAGTYGYMPPEQLMGRPVPASDIYSFAAVAVGLFSGKSPATMPIKDFRLIFEPDVEQLHPAIVGTLRSMLEPKVEDRLKDIDEIIRLFRHYRDNQFTMMPSAHENADRSNLLNKKLLEVDSIGASGNMDLWQQLPEALPRKIPEALIEASKAYQNPQKRENGNEFIDKRQPLPGLSGLPWKFVDAFITACEAYKNYKEKNLSSREFLNKLDPLLWKFVLVWLILTVFLGILNPLFGTLFQIIVVVFIGKIIQISGNYSSHTHEDTTELHKDTTESNTDSSRIISIGIMLKLIESGRKTVATIESIEYIPVSNENVITLVRNRAMIVSMLPAFRVRYKFNPPDDSREEDLVHEFISHSAPEHYYKAGDPLPILYLIEKENFEETVSSLPFPFPIADTVCDQLVFSSKTFIKAVTTESDATQRLNRNALPEYPIEKKHEYRYYFKPMLDATNDSKLIAAMNSCYITDPEVIQVMIQFGIQRILSQKNSDLKRTYLMMLLNIYKSYFYRSEDKERVQTIIINHLLSLLKGEYKNVQLTLGDFNAISERIIYIRFANPSIITDAIANGIANAILGKSHLLSLEGRRHTTIFNALKYNESALHNILSDDDLRKFKKDVTHSLQHAARSILSCDKSVLNIDFKHVTADTDKYGYRYLKAALEHLDNRDALFKDIDQFFLINDDLGNIQKVILFGIEHIWPTDDTELRVHFLKTLICNHYFAKKEAKFFIHEYLKCYICGYTQFQPSFEEYKAFKDHHFRDDVSDQASQIFKSKFVIESK